MPSVSIGEGPATPSSSFAQWCAEKYPAPHSTPVANLGLRPLIVSMIPSGDEEIRQQQFLRLWVQMCLPVNPLSVLVGTGTTTHSQGMMPCVQVPEVILSAIKSTILHFDGRQSLRLLISSMDSVLADGLLASCREQCLARPFFWLTASTLLTFQHLLSSLDRKPPRLKRNSLSWATVQWSLEQSSSTTQEGYTRFPPISWSKKKIFISGRRRFWW